MFVGDKVLWFFDEATGHSGCFDIEIEYLLIVDIWAAIVVLGWFVKAYVGIV